MLTLVLLVSCCGLVWAQDFVPTNYEEVTQATNGGFGAIDRCGEGEGLGKMHCVPYHRCDPDTNVTIPEPEENQPEQEYDYSLLIDIRLGETRLCQATLDVCCKIAPDGPSPSPSTTSTTESSGGIEPPTPRPVLSSCGLRNNNGIDFKITGNTHGEAEYGEFPWMVAILKSNYNPAVDPILAVCGGSLLAPRVILTAAHCVKKFTPSDIKVRAGEWDTQTTNERYPYQERDVAEIIIHEGYKEGVLHNDVALLILERPIAKARHIATICLPNQDEVIDSKECYATGWGKDLFGKKGAYQVILKKIHLPIVPSQKCEAELKNTRLGKFFKLHESFICAGGIEGMDTCTGDGGSPLVCPDPNNPARYVQTGIVAWGIDCATTKPGVYANVAKFRNWVDGHVQRLSLSDKPYTQ